MIAKKESGWRDLNPHQPAPKNSGPAASSGIAGEYRGGPLQLPERSEPVGASRTFAVDYRWEADQDLRALLESRAARIARRLVE